MRVLHSLTQSPYFIFSFESATVRFCLQHSTKLFLWRPPNAKGDFQSSSSSVLQWHLTQRVTHPYSNTCMGLRHFLPILLLPHQALLSLFGCILIQIDQGGFHTNLMGRCWEKKTNLFSQSCIQFVSKEVEFDPHFWTWFLFVCWKSLTSLITHKSPIKKLHRCCYCQDIIMLISKGCSGNSMNNIKDT